MVNLQSLVSSSPKDQVTLEPQDAKMEPPKAGSAPRGTVANEAGPSLTRLMESSDDEFPLAERSNKKKRARMSSPPPVPPSVQAKRRTKNAGATKRGTRAGGASVGVGERVKVRVWCLGRRWKADLICGVGWGGGEESGGEEEVGVGVREVWLDWVPERR